jgi:hypothetical protein
LPIKEHIDKHASTLSSNVRSPCADTALPKGNRFYAHEFPASVLRDLKPHHSDWRKLDANQARSLGANPNYRFFSLSHGHWSAVRDAQTASRGEHWLAFVRATPVPSGGGGGGGGAAGAAAALTPAELNDLIAYSQAMSLQEQEAKPVKMQEYRKLTIIVLPGNPDTPKPVRFSINGAQGAK